MPDLRPRFVAISLQNLIDIPTLGAVVDCCRRRLGQWPRRQAAAEADGMERCLRVVFDQLNHRLEREKVELDGIEMREQSAVQRDVRSRDDFFSTRLVPVVTRALLQLASLAQQPGQRRADPLAGSKVIPPRQRVFADVRVVNEFADLDPDVARRQRMVVSFALVVVPGPSEHLVRGEARYVYPFISRTTTAQDLAIIGFERGRPLLDERFPLIGREGARPERLGDWGAVGDVARWERSRRGLRIDFPEIVFSCQTSPRALAIIIENLLLRSE